MGTPPKPRRTLTTRDVSRSRDVAFAATLGQLETLARRRTRRTGPRPAWEWFDDEVTAALRAAGEAHPVHGRAAFHPGEEPRFLPPEELPHPYDTHAREFRGVYQHPYDTVFSAEYALWERRFFARDVAELVVDLRAALEESLAVFARRLVARSRRRHVSTMERLRRLDALHAYGGAFDVLRRVLLDHVRATNQALTWLAGVPAVPAAASKIEPLRPAAFQTAVWLVQHHPTHQLVIRDLVMVLLAGRWPTAKLYEQDTEETKLVRAALREEAERQAGHALDEAALLAFLRTWS